MATEKQVSANRQNALKSRGPTSVLGKMISSRNSTSHGFYATDVLLPDEDRDEFYRLARRLVRDYKPIGPRQEELVKTIIETHWQLRRSNRVDTELYQMYRFYEGNQGGVGTAFAHDASQANAFSKRMRYDGFLWKKLQSAEKALADLKARSSVSQPTSDLSLADMQNPPLIAVTTTSVVSETNELTPAQVLAWLKLVD